MADPIALFCDAIRSAGLVPPEVIKADGNLHRFSSNGKRGDDAGFYVLHLDGIPSGWIGDWRTGISQPWRADIGRPLTDAEERAHQTKLSAIRVQRKVEEQSRRAAAAEKAMTLWQAAVPATSENRYLFRKQVHSVENLREIGADEAAEILGYSPKSAGERLEGRLLVVPVKVDNTLSTCELIDGDGRKSAIYGGAKAGGYWAAQTMPEAPGTDTCLLIGEGVATLLSAVQASSFPGVAALSAGNLLPVARQMRERFPDADLVVLADLDKSSGSPDGRAIEAAQAVGARLAVPCFGDDSPKGASDFNDMATISGMKFVARAIETARKLDVTRHPGSVRLRTGQPAIKIDWPEPQPLTLKVHPDPYPIDALPAVIRAAVLEVAGFVKAPLPLVASSALAALSLAAQAHADVKRAEKLVGPTGLFLLTIADSGERKSTCDGFFTQSIRDYERAQAEAAKPILNDHSADIEAWEAKRSGIKERIRALAKDNKSTMEMESALRKLEHDRPEPPKIPRLFYSDATPEALAYGLAKQWPSSGVVSSEAGIVFGSHAMGKEAVMRNLSMLNQLWDGADLTVDRRTTESFTVQGVRLTVALQIQEPTLREFFIRSGALARGTGFLARFLFAWPESTQGSRRFTEAPLSWPDLARFNRRIAAILDRSLPLSNGILVPPILQLAPEAKAAWIAYHDGVEAMLRAGGDLYDVRDVASKSADNAARLAALFQRFEQDNDAPIGITAFEGASRIAAWHLNEARRFFGELALPPEFAHASRLDDWLLDQCRRDHIHHMPMRQVQQFVPTVLREKATLESALQELQELGRVRIVANGRRRTIYVNPSLLSDSNLPLRNVA